MKRRLTLAVLALLSWPGVIPACPMCNVRGDATTRIIGIFLLLPFLVFSGAFLIYRSISRKESTNP